MNRIFFFSLMIPAAVLAACGGKVIVDGLPPNGAGGAGGAGGATTTSGSMSSNVNTTTVGTTGSTGPGQTTAGSGPSCDPKYSCAEAISPPNGDPKLLCPGSQSYNLYQALLKCTCGGPCAAACAGNTCLGQMATPSCIKCVQTQGMGCGNEFKTCANDL